MSAFQRLSEGPSIPDLIRREADHAAYQSLEMLPKEAWCRPAMIAVVWHHRNNGIMPSRASAIAEWDRITPSRSDYEVARKRIAIGLSPNCSTQARSRAIARSRRALVPMALVAKTLQVWSERRRVYVCFAVASCVLAAARVLDQCGVLAPQGLGAALRWSDHLTRGAMRIWRRRKRSSS